MQGSGWNSIKPLNFYILNCVERNNDIKLYFISFPQTEAKQIIEISSDGLKESAFLLSHYYGYWWPGETEKYGPTLQIIFSCPDKMF